MARNLEPKKLLVNTYEATTHRLLEGSAAANGARVFSKVRVADVLPIEGSGVSSELYGFALRAHFDFVVADEASRPLFAVEYDGHQHETADGRSRDKKKNALCEEFMFPLARVRDEHIFREARGVDYLTWLAELFFSTKALEEAQENGIIPEDEPIDPMMFVTHPRIEGAFPLMLAGPARVALQKHARRGTILGPVPTSFTSCDDRGVTKTVAMISAPNGKTFWSEAEIYLWRFGSGACEVTDELATIRLESFVREPDSAHNLAMEPVAIYDALVRFFCEYPLPMTDTSAGGLKLPFSFGMRQIGGRREYFVGAFEGRGERVFETARFESARW